jgi:hypothetical protein
MTDRPQEIRGPRVLANFRPSLKERSKKHVSAQERREGNSAKHLACIRQMPCAACLMVNLRNDPHHLKSGPAGNERGVGMKATDKWAVPLCRPCHDSVERVGTHNEVSWFRDRGIAEPHELASALFKASGKLGQMVRILMAHREVRK